MAKSDQDTINRVVRAFDEDKKPHDTLRHKWERYYRAYKGMIEARSDAASYTNKQHPAYVWQIVETMVANLVARSPAIRVRCAPGMGPAEITEQMVQGARANELLLNHQLQIDKIAEKQRTFALQGLILGVTAGKESWEYKVGSRRSQRTVQEPIIGEYGVPMGAIDRQVDASETTVLRDNPTFEPVDMRDLVWHQAATSLRKCQRVTHRCWYTMGELLQMEKVGAFGKNAGGQSVTLLSDSKDMATPEGVYDRESDLFDVKKTKDMIEVLEQWVINPNAEGGLEQIVVGNRKVLLAHRPSPFWLEHLDHPFPFVVCSGSPDLFVVPGMSEVEVMAELQEMMWTLLNQRLDNLQLVNNAIILEADDLENQGERLFGPGERWLVPRPVNESVQMWSPDVRVAEISLQAEALLKGDMQNVTGGMPMLSGIDSGNIDQQTATGVSIVTTLAQRRIAAKQQQFVWAMSRVAEQFLALNQQFIREDRLIPIVGADGAVAFETIRPQLLQGNYAIESEMIEESLVRQERRAESQSLLQVATQVAPVAAQFGVFFSFKALFDKVLESHDIADKERYYAQPPQQQIPPPPGGPQQSPQNGGGGGVTNSQLAAGPTSPSNEVSMNPVAALQRMAAMSGGAANTG